MRTERAAFGLLACMVLQVGCAGALPAERVAAPRETMRAAVEVGALENPRASFHLNQARYAVEQADVLLDDGDELEALGMLSCAEADAELALTLARHARVEREVRDVRSKIDELEARTRLAPSPGGRQ